MVKVARSRNPQIAQNAVLDAALKLFAEKGFAETSLRQISVESGVSHPLILHHFGSKDDLYKAVKRRVVEGYGERFPAAAHDVQRPINIRAEMRRLMTYLGENELAMKLCARVRVDGDYQVWPGEPDIFNVIRQRIEVAQRRGLVRADLQASLLSIMIIGLVIFWLDGRRCFAQRFENLPDDEAYLNDAVRLLQQGLQILPSTAQAEGQAACQEMADSPDEN